MDFQLELLHNPLPGEGNGKSFIPFGPGFYPAPMIAVIEKVREMSGWLEAKAERSKHSGMGFACYWSHLGYAAQVHRVAVDEAGIVTPERVWVALDIGKHVINPINAQNQIRGSILDGTSAAAAQQITFDAGCTVQSNFHNYLIPRNRRIPHIEHQFVKSEYAPTGLGEPAYPSALPAFCNAMFAASGKRVRNLPTSSLALKL